jgi:hypothetical protein
LIAVRVEIVLMGFFQLAKPKTLFYGTQTLVAIPILLKNYYGINFVWNKLLESFKDWFNFPKVLNPYSNGHHHTPQRPTQPS